MDGGVSSRTVLPFFEDFHESGNKSAALPQHGQAPSSSEAMPRNTRAPRYSGRY